MDCICILVVSEGEACAMIGVPYPPVLGAVLPLQGCGQDEWEGVGQRCLKQSSGEKRNRLTRLNEFRSTSPNPLHAQPKGGG